MLKQALLGLAIGALAPLTTQTAKADVVFRYETYPRGYYAYPDRYDSYYYYVPSYRYVVPDYGWGGYRSRPYYRSYDHYRPYYNHGRWDRYDHGRWDRYDRHDGHRR